MTIPHGTRLLLVTTTAVDRQFAGIVKACREIGRKKACHHLAFQGRSLDLRHRSALSWVVISGHGSEKAARIGTDRSKKIAERPLMPEDLLLPSRCCLLLLSCYQGRKALGALWSEGTGVSRARVMGCCGETESALSTLFLLHILAEGPDGLLHWFENWVEINDRLRPHFPLARRIYQQNHGRFLDTLTALGERVDMGRYGDFLSLTGEYGDYLDALA